MVEHAPVTIEHDRLALKLLEHVNYYTKGYWPSAWPQIIADAFAEQEQKWLNLFSDYEQPCESFEQAERIWNQTPHTNWPPTGDVHHLTHSPE